MVAELLRVRLRCDELAPGTARRVFAQHPETDEELADVSLVLSELVTNAVRYSGCGAEDELTVSATRDDRRLRVSVCDPGRSGGAARFSDDRDAGGFGLRIVEQLSVGWGALRRQDGYEVWAELDFRSPN